MVTCYIAIGSNLGDRRYNIEAALRRVRTLANTKVMKVSRIIETMPQGGPEQAPFLNAVFAIATDLTPYHLLQELQRIEAMLGRARTVLNGPRTIDLDILTYGTLCMNEPALCIPHPRMFERRFVVVPLEEIAPDAVRRIRKQMGAGKSKKAKGKRESRKVKPAKKSKRSLVKRIHKTQRTQRAKRKS